MEVLSVIADVLTPAHLLAMLAGVVGGLCIGALPGLTSNLGVALLLPVTFGMDPISALIMLTSLYAAAIYAGSFPAILLHTPGTSASAATAIDGFALTRKGEFNKAIRIATFSSVCGGVFSALMLLVIAPPLSLLSLKFGPPEYFMLAVFGLTIIGTLASGNMIKGLMSGAAGLAISTVGLDLDSGFPRFAFGSTDLQGGIGFVPAVIGLFSLSQALLMCEEPHRTIQQVKVTAGGQWRLFPTRDEIRQIRATVMRSSLIGGFIGILPGAGGDIGSWAAYNEAKRFSRNDPDFGKGSIRGVAASESANNATTGSAMVPLLTLGIPGSPTAAILLGALIIHGLQPGRTLFTVHAHFTYTVIVGFLLANLVMGFIGMGLGRYMGVVARLPNSILIAVVVVLSVVGAFSLGNNMYDVYTMMAFGLLGYLMRKGNFSPAPMVLGMILGPMAEQGFRQSVILADGPVVLHLLGSPISITLAALSLLSIVSAGYLEFKRTKAARAAG
ncbi:MAG: tripartite tricarboxylate transporter permease [Pseudolabrys sp.]|nr:tripartite tricarboxylate transporter permease [Pseudolabrys sp.]